MDGLVRRCQTADNVFTVYWLYEARVTSSNAREVHSSAVYSVKPIVRVLRCGCGCDQGRFNFKKKVENGIEILVSVVSFTTFTCSTLL